MHVFRIFNNSLVLEDTGDYCVGEHAARYKRLCREKRDVVGQCEEGEHGLI
jgi:hypothetical protein